MQRTRLIESEVGTGTSVGAATSINNATCVRLHNDTSGTVVIGVATEVSAGTALTFTMPGNSVEFLEKLATDVIYSSISIKASKVGFTN